MTNGVWNDWYLGWGWFLWFGILMLAFSSVGNWGYTYRVHRFSGRGPQKGRARHPRRALRSRRDHAHRVPRDEDNSFQSGRAAMSHDMLDVTCRETSRGLRMPAAATQSRERPAAAVGVADLALGDVMDPQPSSRGFIAMLEVYRARGGMAPGNFLCQTLQEHQRGDLAQLARLIGDRRIFVLDWQGDLWIPMFQFDADDLSCKTGPALVRAELAGLDSGWAIASWFAQPNTQLGGRLPVDVVDPDLGSVVDAARCRALASELERRMATYA
jgi:hypothetical protein